MLSNDNTLSMTIIVNCICTVYQFSVKSIRILNFSCDSSSISHNVGLSVCQSVCRSVCRSVCLCSTSFIDAFWPCKCIIVAIVVVSNLVSVVDIFLAANDLYK